MSLRSATYFSWQRNKLQFTGKILKVFMDCGLLLSNEMKSLNIEVYRTPSITFIDKNRISVVYSFPLVFISERSGQKHGFVRKFCLFPVQKNHKSVGSIISTRHMQQYIGIPCRGKAKSSTTLIYLASIVRPAVQ